MRVGGDAPHGVWYASHASPPPATLPAAWALPAERMLSPRRSGAREPQQQLGSIDIGGQSPYAMSPQQQQHPPYLPHSPPGGTREQWSQNTATPTRGLGQPSRLAHVPPSGVVPPVDISFLLDAQEQHRRDGGGGSHTPRLTTAGTPATTAYLGAGTPRTVVKEISTQTSADAETQTRGVGGVTTTSAVAPRTPPQGPAASPLHGNRTPLGDGGSGSGYVPGRVVMIDDPHPHDWDPLGGPDALGVAGVPPPGDVTTVWELYQRYAHAKTEGRERDAEDVIEQNNTSVRRTASYLSRASSPAASPRLTTRSSMGTPRQYAARPPRPATPQGGQHHTQLKSALAQHHLPQTKPRSSTGNLPSTIGGYPGYDDAAAGSGGGGSDSGDSRRASAQVSPMRGSGRVERGGGAQSGCARPPSPHQTVEDVVRAYSHPRGGGGGADDDYNSTTLAAPSPHALPQPEHPLPPRGRPPQAHPYTSVPVAVSDDGGRDGDGSGSSPRNAPSSPSPEPNYPADATRPVRGSAGQRGKGGAPPRMLQAVTPHMPPSPIVAKAPSPRVGMLGRWRDHRGAVFVLAQPKLAVWELLFVLPDTEEVLTVFEATWLLAAPGQAPHSRAHPKPRSLQMDTTGALLQAASLPIRELHRIIAYDSRRNWLTFEFTSNEPPKIKLRFDSGDGKRSTTCTLHPLEE